MAVSVFFREASPCWLNLWTWLVTLTQIIRHAREVFYLRTLLATWNLCATALLLHWCCILSSCDIERYLKVFYMGKVQPENCSLIGPTISSVPWHTTQLPPGISNSSVLRNKCWIKSMYACFSWNTSCVSHSKGYKRYKNYRRLSTEKKVTEEKLWLDRKLKYFIFCVS
jgi:hypothetical protein